MSPYDDPAALAVLSLGAGVQSTTLLLMACHGEIEPRPVEAIFADTGWEPRAVYEHLDWLASVSSIPITRVSAGNIREDALSGERFAKMPVYVRYQNGTGRSMLSRQCTQDYKISPIRRHIRTTYPAQRVMLQMGISLDEAMRMRDSGVRYITNVYPLVDRRMTRHDCLLWLERHGYPRPPKSSCIGCPYHDGRYWREMQRERPDEWADAVAFDAAIRTALPRVTGEVFLHRSMIPLAQVDLTTPEDHGQLSLFDAECTGHCGV
jgi:hypothetical protein